MYKSPYETYIEMYVNDKFLTEFSQEEVSYLTSDVIQEGVNLFITQLIHEGYDLEERIDCIIEELNSYGFILQESNSLDELQEEVLLEIINTLKRAAKGAVKSGVRAAGYGVGLGVRVAKGIARLFGKGYNRGRGYSSGGGGYSSSPSRAGSTSSSSEDIEDDEDNEDTRGFRGKSGIRAAIGKAARSLAAPPQKKVDQKQRVAGLVAQRKAAQDKRSQRLASVMSRMPASRTRVTSSGQTPNRPISVSASPIPGRASSPKPTSSTPNTKPAITTSRITRNTPSPSGPSKVTTTGGKITPPVPITMKSKPLTAPAIPPKRKS